MKVKIISESVLPLPKYQTQGSAGMDLMSNETINIPPNMVYAVDTGISIELPFGYEAQVRTRSGMSLKDIVVNNAPGTIDSDFRGRIRVILKNQSNVPYRVTMGDRIAQLVVAKVEKVEWVEADSMTETLRGERGFGSSGK
jgi:dUTP pyrophosphatase